MSIAACGSTPGMHMEPAGWFAVDAAAALGGEMLKLGEQLHLNDTQVREAERRLGHQHTFIARLHASSRDTTSAQESLEVIRAYGVSIRSVLSCDENCKRQGAFAAAIRARAQRRRPMVNGAVKAWTCLPSGSGLPEKCVPNSPLRTQEADRLGELNKHGTGSAAAQSCPLVSPTV